MMLRVATMDTPKFLASSATCDALIGIAIDLGSLRDDGAFAALGKNLFDLGVRARNDMC